MKSAQLNFSICLLLFAVVLGSCKKKVEPDKPKNDWWFHSVSVHPNNKQVALGGLTDTLEIRTVTDLSILEKIPVEGTISKLDWHPTKNLLAVAIEEKELASFILDLDKLTKILLDSVYGSKSVAWSPSGKLLAAGCIEGNLFFYDEHGLLKDVVPQESKAISDISWKPDGSTLVSVGNHVSLYDIGKKNLHTTIDSIRPFINAIAWHPNLDFFVTGNYGNSKENVGARLQFWNAQGYIVKAIERSKAPYHQVVWSTDGKYLATASDAIRIWSNDGTLLQEDLTNTVLLGLDWVQDSRAIFTVSDNGEFKKWNFKALSNE